jgi:hypothetical protein
VEYSSTCYNTILWQIPQMRSVKSILPMLTLAAVMWLAFVMADGLWADNPVSRAGEAIPGVTGDEVLAKAIAELDGHTTISARIRQQVHLFDQHLVGSGVYLQAKGAFGHNLTRFELKMQLQDEVSRMLEVCDGQFLWATRELKNGDPVYPLNKVDVKRVLSARPAAGQGGAIPRLALGGFSRFIQSLRQGFEFHETAEDFLGDLPVYRLRGVWRPEQLVQFLPEQKAAIEAGQGGDLRKLEPHVPDEVFVYLGQDDLFPYRIEFRRDGSPLVNCEVSELQLDVAIDPAQFQFDPGPKKQEIPDTTTQFLLQYGLEERPQ